MESEDNIKPKHAGGRPTKLTPEHIVLAKKLAKFGLIDEQLAEALDVDVRTIYRWKVDHREFCQALKVGKKQADDIVEQSLYQRANGYSHPELMVFNNKGELVEKEVIKHYPPDTTAAIFWLKNRRPDKWRDKTVQEHEGGFFDMPHRVEVELVNPETPDETPPEPDPEPSTPPTP